MWMTFGGMWVRASRWTVSGERPVLWLLLISVVSAVPLCTPDFRILMCCQPLEDFLQT